MYSFVIRGIKINVKDLMKMLNLEQYQIGTESDYDTFDYFRNKFRNLSVEANGNFFGKLDYTTLIIGEDIGYLEDGEVEEFDDRTQEQDDALRKRLNDVGITGILKTYIQAISKK